MNKLKKHVQNLLSFSLILLFSPSRSIVLSLTKADKTSRVAEKSLKKAWRVRKKSAGFAARSAGWLEKAARSPEKRGLESEPRFTGKRRGRLVSEESSSTIFGLRSECSLAILRIDRPKGWERKIEIDRSTRLNCAER